MPAKYFDYADIFSFDLVMGLPENIGINEHVIELVEGKQSSYRLIYTFSPIELETLKTDIKIHLKTGFIWPFKSLTSTFILFDKKPGSNLYLYMNY